MSMDAKTLVLDVLRDLGAREAAQLRAGAADMDGTTIIAMERAHRAADYEGRPSTLRALWGLTHTKDAARAKPWVDPAGQSGMYMTGECYLAKDGKVYRCKQDACVWDAEGMPSAWEEV